MAGLLPSRPKAPIPGTESSDGERRPSDAVGRWGRIGAIGFGSLSLVMAG